MLPRWISILKVFAAPVFVFQKANIPTNVADKDTMPTRITIHFTISIVNC